MHFPSQTPTIHFYYALFFLLAWHPYTFCFGTHSRYQSTSFTSYSPGTTSTLFYIDSLGNAVILHSLHMTDPSENTFINDFVYALRHSPQFRHLRIRKFIHSHDTQQTSEVVYLYTLILALSFSFHIIFSLPYIRTATDNIS